MTEPQTAERKFVLDFGEDGAWSYTLHAPDAHAAAQAGAALMSMSTPHRVYLTDEDENRTAWDVTHDGHDYTTIEVTTEKEQTQ